MKSQLADGIDNHPLYLLDTINNDDERVFKEEKELFYKDFALAVCHDGQTLKNAVEEAECDNGGAKKQDITQFSYKNPVGAYHYCAQLLAKL